MTEQEEISEWRRYAKLTKATAYPVIERYFASGELPSTFYRREGLTEHQFYKWRKYYLQDHPSVASRLGLDASPGRSRKSSRKAKCRVSDKRAVSACKDTGFVRILAGGVASEGNPPASAPGTWEIEYPNGVRLRISPETPLETVARLIVVAGL